MVDSNAIVECNKEGSFQSQQVVWRDVSRGLRVVTCNGDSIVRFGKEEADCTYLGALIEASVIEEELAICIGEIIQDEPLPEMSLITIKMILNMSKGSVGNNWVIMIDISKDCITARFPYKPGSCSDNKNDVHRVIAISNPSSRFKPKGEGFMSANFGAELRPNR